MVKNDPLIQGVLINKIKSTLPANISLADELADDGRAPPLGQDQVPAHRLPGHDLLLGPQAEEEEPGRGLQDSDLVESKPGLTMMEAGKYPCLFYFYPESLPMLPSL